METEQVRQAWYRAGLSVVLLLLLTLVLYQHTLLHLVSLWNQIDDGEYAHGYLVLAISGYLIFINRQRLAGIIPCVQYQAISGVVAASILWMVAALVGVEMMQTVGLLLLILAILWSVLGNRVIRVLAFPVLYISFAIPIWFPLSPVLQDVTADVVYGIVRLLAIPALRQENNIMLPSGIFSVEEACSGLRYLLAALTLGTLYAYTNYSSLRARLFVVLISAGAAILANMLRVFIVVYLGYVTEMQHPLVGDHLFLGWYLFGGLVVILLFIDARLNKGLVVSVSDTPVVPQGSGCPDSKGTSIKYYMYVVAIGLLLSIAPVVIYQTSHQSTSTVAGAVAELPQAADGWLRAEVIDDGWMPEYHGAINQKQSYKKNNVDAVLYVGFYPEQKQGKELIYYLNRVSTGDRWRAVYNSPRLAIADDQQVLEQLLDNGEKKQLLVWYWYNIAGIVTTNKYAAKVLQVWGLLTGRPWAFVTAVAVESDDDIEDARQILNDFILAIKKKMDKETGLFSVYTSK